MKTLISKTDFLEYLKCPKCFWVKKKKPELYTAPGFTDFEKKNLREGQEVELLARKLFNEGILVDGRVEDLVIKTKELVVQKDSPIFQATFSTNDGLLAKIDILEYNLKSNCWNIYEVKSSNKINTDRAHNHIKDVTFQKIVIEKFGISVGKTYIVHLNKDYKKIGELDIDGLFVKSDVTTDVERAYDITQAEINSAISLLQDNNVSVDSCSCAYLTRKNHCSCFNILNAGVPDYSVHDISRIHINKLKSLVDAGVFDIVDVSDSFELTDAQRNQVILAQTQKAQIDNQKIKQALDNLEYPLYFLDYETYATAIPILDGFSPHQQVPFQVSIHTFDSDENLKHFEYLAESINGAVTELIELMKSVIKSGGSIISWHASFENTRNKEMAELYLQYNDFLLELNGRTFDLESIFKKDYTHPKFKGKTSIKSILPVLLPKFSYEELDIQGGTEAMESWRKMVFEDISNQEKMKIKKNLLEYCKMDTLAMVEIFKHLREIQ